MRVLLLLLLIPIVRIPVLSRRLVVRLLILRMSVPLLVGGEGLAGNVLPARLRSVLLLLRTLVRGGRVRIGGGGVDGRRVAVPFFAHGGVESLPFPFVPVDRLRLTVPPSSFTTQTLGRPSRGPRVRSGVREGNVFLWEAALGRVHRKVARVVGFLLAAVEPDDEEEVGLNDEEEQPETSASRDKGSTGVVSSKNLTGRHEEMELEHRRRTP